MMDKLYVGNLSFDVTEDELFDAFATIGQVHAAEIIRERDTGRSRGFGFVELSNGAKERAILEMNGKEIKGRRIIVNPARPKQSAFGAQSAR